MRVAIIGIATLSLGAIYYWHASLIRSIELQIDQWRCMHFSRPADGVAFEEDLAAGAKLALGDAGYHKVENDFHNPGVSFYSYRYEPLHLVAASPGQSPDTWTSGAMMDQLLFLHERLSPSGHRRLVVVMAFSDDCFTADVIKPVDWFASPPRWRYVPEAWIVNHSFVQLIDFQTWAGVRSGPLPRPPEEITRIFFGQPDPENASHFTIRYKVRDQEGLIDGWLCDNDAVYLRPRFGPRMATPEYYDRMAALIGFDYSRAMADIGIRSATTRN